MRKLFLSLLIWLIAPAVFSQTIKGKLVDSMENVPIEYASVAVYNQKDSTLVTGTVTSQEGDFEIQDVKPGRYYLTAQFMGYETKTVDNITIEKNETVNLSSLALLPNQQMLDEIEITGEKVTTVHKVDRQVFEADKFQANQGGTATDVLRNLPSISVDAQGQIRARGSSGFVVLINGKPVQTDATVILNQMPANAVQNIEIITAPSAKYDPEGKAGIINIITHQGAADGLFAQVNARVGMPSIEDYNNAESAPRFGGDFTINYRENKWDISLGASYLRNDITGRREGDVFTMIQDTLTRFPSDGERSFDEVNYSGRFTIGYTPNPRNNYSVGFFAGKRSKDRTADILYFDNHAVFKEERLYTLQYFNENLRIRKGDFVLGSFDYSHLFENKSRLSTSLLYEYTLLGGPTTNRNLGWPDTNVVFQDEFNTNDNPLNGLRFQADYQSKPLNIGTIEAGYQFRDLDHTGDFVYERKNNETGIFELVPEFSSNVELRRRIHAAYAQLSGNKGKWDYGVGLRLEYMDRELDLKDKAGTMDTTYLYDFVKPFPTANVQYTINDGLKIKAAYSKRIERTTTFKMNPFPEREHSETLEQGDPELLPEFIDLVELGFIKDFGENSVYATGYFRNVENLVNRVNNVYNDTILNRIYSNVGVGRSYGFEVGAELKPAKWWQVFAGGNLYHYEIEGTFDDRPVNTSGWIYSINANMTFHLPRDYSVQWSLNYISDRNTAQGEDSRFLSPNLTVRKGLLDNRLTATLQWLHMDMGLLESNEQRITTFREGEFFTTTNYVYEVDMIMLNLSYALNKSENKAKFIKSEFGEKEF
ncbi:MAG: TonB-dependent receptor [Cytophagales bacterium]|nr:TonB-dependent receptor [Cytophagales bacterium]